MKIRGKNIKITTVLLSATLFFPSLAFAQHDGNGQGYVFGSFGTIYDSPEKRVGGGIGFEKLFGPGVGFGLDFQGFGAITESSSSYGGSTPRSARSTFTATTSSVSKSRTR